MMIPRPDPSLREISPRAWVIFVNPITTKMTTTTTVTTKRISQKPRSFLKNFNNRSPSKDIHPANPPISKNPWCLHPSSPSIRTLPISYRPIADPALVPWSSEQNPLLLQRTLCINLHFRSIRLCSATARVRVSPHPFQTLDLWQRSLAPISDLFMAVMSCVNYATCIEGTMTKLCWQRVEVRNRTKRGNGGVDRGTWLSCRKQF